ncbi:protein of unknown function (DUF202) domain containing protein [Amanita muscaria]
MESLPQKYLELECENGRVVTETTPLKTSCPLNSSYVNQATGRSVDRERRKRRKTPSVSRASKKDHQSHRDESASTVVEVEEDDRERRGDHRRKHVPRFIALRSLVLKNTGSVARDHLASERTFLAYMRTSLTLVAAAIALVQIFLSAAPRDHPKTNAVHGLGITVRTLAASTIILGMIVLFIGIQRYFAIQAALTMGKFPAARLPVLVIAASLLVLISITLSIMLTRGLGI